MTMYMTPGVVIVHRIGITSI